SQVAGATGIEAAKPERLRQCRDPRRELVDLLELVPIIVEIGDWDERTPLDRGIGRLRAWKELVELEEWLLDVQNLLDARRNPDHKSSCPRPDFPDLGLALTLIVRDLRLALAVPRFPQRDGFRRFIAESLADLPPCQPGALCDPAHLCP